MKFKRINSFEIALKYNVNVIIGKDFGSMGRSKPFFYVMINDKIVQHGFSSQKEAKEYLAEKYTIVKFVIFRGSVIALFPGLKHNNFSSNITSYERRGQHGSASKSLMRCKSSSKAEYSSLEKELISIGYDNLIIINAV